MKDKRPAPRKSKRPFRRPTRKIRKVNLLARFHPEKGVDVADQSQFIQFVADVRQAAADLNRKQRTAQQKHEEALRKAMEKVYPVLMQMGAREIEHADGQRRLAKLVPDLDLRRQAFDRCGENLVKPLLEGASSEELARFWSELAGDLEAMRQRERRGKKYLAGHGTIAELAEVAGKGDAEAAEMLVDLAAWAAGMLRCAQNLQPALFQAVARRKTHWAILVSDDTEKGKADLSRIAELDLGAELREIHVRFRKARGSDENYPARRWAKGAVRVAETTRWRLRVLSALIRDFHPSDAFREYCWDSGWDLEYPEDFRFWMTELPPFSSQTLEQWKPVVRGIVKEQIPHFERSSDWETQRRTAKARGRHTLGEVQGAILDDIVSALGTIAPNEKC